MQIKYKSFISRFFKGVGIIFLILFAVTVFDIVITVYNKTINKGAYSNIDWTTRATILDDFTEEDKIISNEVYDNVVYDSVGNYYVKLEAYDLSGNRKEYQFIVTVQQIPGC